MMGPLGWMGSYTQLWCLAGFTCFACLFAYRFIHIFSMRFIQSAVVQRVPDSRVTGNVLSAYGKQQRSNLGLYVCQTEAFATKPWAFKTYLKGEAGTTC